MPACYIIIITTIVGFLLGCTSQLKLPQQVALTEFKRQVSANVKVIIVTQNIHLIHVKPPQQVDLT